MIVLIILAIKNGKEPTPNQANNTASILFPSFPTVESNVDVVQV